MINLALTIFFGIGRFFVTPSDSVAIIAANAVESIPYFSAGLKGVARSNNFLLSLHLPLA